MGEIVLRGNVVMKGYLKNPSASAEAMAEGWFRSGDLAVWHPDGYVEIKDRSKDIIISGGENISSLEVEDVLYRHPDVDEVAVIAMPDEKWGEVPCAFVKLKEGRELSQAELIAFCREQMAHFKAPSASSSPRCRKPPPARCRNLCCAGSWAVEVATAVKQNGPDGPFCRYEFNDYLVWRS